MRKIKGSKDEITFDTKVKQKTRKYVATVDSIFPSSTWKPVLWAL